MDVCFIVKFDSTIYSKYIIFYFFFLLKVISCDKFLDQ